jgi:tRNA threonylcarbamoyladenosine biosynthesis protein TsaB
MCIRDSSNARFIDNLVPLASNMIELAEKKFAAKDFVDVAYFEPFYLKEFQATIPKKNI